MKKKNANTDRQTMLYLCLQLGRIQYYLSQGEVTQAKRIATETEAAIYWGTA